jgi:hypothetical protein
MGKDSLCAAFLCIYIREKSALLYINGQCTHIDEKKMFYLSTYLFDRIIINESILPRRFLINCSKRIFLSGFIFRLCKSVFNIIIAKAKINIVSTLVNNDEGFVV